ncbi:MAG: efflux RND transporter permease subunit [Candidatus Auribacterota bacterium]|jgi:multidrug efflux pump subunit AcrB|nr:efflux RND transporter permease subunit [Candidatus Auribacterota bacterium]
MWREIINYFATRHFLTNFLVIMVFVGGIFAWNNTSKEEMPDITFNTVRINVRYPGAPAEDVEYFVTKPLEEKLRGLDGIYRITSTSSVSSCSIAVEIQPNYSDIDELLTEIRNEVLSVDLPDDILDPPTIRVFKTSRKAILDVGLVHNQTHLLDVPTRQELQKYAKALEDQLLNLPEVNSINKSGYLQEEIQIKLDPVKLVSFKIPFNTVKKTIQSNHIRQPAGSVETTLEPKVTLLSELDTIGKLNRIIVQGGFEGGVVRLDEVGDVVEGFEKKETIIKINGREGIMLNVVKNSTYGIIDAIDAVIKVTEKFNRTVLKDTPIEMILLDDESLDIRNRLNLIAMNGMMGFGLILVALFIFLNVRSAIWVAMGIPFTFCFTMICMYYFGYTINGTTLAAVIIVMGIIVDDAIVVAENISRMWQTGIDRTKAAIDGTLYVLLPIVASIVTTCIAFVPLYYFRGRFGEEIKFIPPIIFMMLGASLFESILILPAHMNLHIPFITRKVIRKSDKKIRRHWFETIEDLYGFFLRYLIWIKPVVFAGFVVLLIWSLDIAVKNFKFVMFPHEETREIVISGQTPPGSDRTRTAILTKQLEDIIQPYIGKEVIGLRNIIARGRGGSSSEDNKFRIVVEILPKEKRDKSADQLIREFQAQLGESHQFQKLRFAKSRWGQSSGSPIELNIQQNDDHRRIEIVNELRNRLEAYPPLYNVEIDEGLQITEYQIHIDQEKIKRLSIEPLDISETLRGALEGSILYTFQKDDQDINVRITSLEEAKSDIENILDLPIENKGDYLVPLRDIVMVNTIEVPSSIYRRDLKRTTLMYADIKPNSGVTPIEAAQYIEDNILPEFLSKYPTTTFSFTGEVQDTRESEADFIRAIILTLFLIYSVLAILFSSMFKPVIIMLAIPFGVVGIILAFWLHNRLLFGFYASVGALGLAGVVINDSIIMLVKLDNEFDHERNWKESFRQIADIAKTRLRAVILTTLTTVAGVLPTAYGFAGYDPTLAEMMLALSWGLAFGTIITLLLIPCIYSVEKDLYYFFKMIRRKLCKQNV